MPLENLNKAISDELNDAASVIEAGQRRQSVANAALRTLQAIPADQAELIEKAVSGLSGAQVSFDIAPAT
jgi:hypothetical protein